MGRHAKPEALRKSGLDFIGDVPWGTHFCQFYQTKEDLVDILVPYFRAGLENNEFCMWVTSPPLEVKEAKAALRKAVPDLEKYIRKGQITILSYADWYLLSGTFDSGRVLQGWVEKEKAALRSGLDGLRLTGNTFWLERNGWKAFTDYEEEVNNAIGKYRMMAICTYSLEKCNANEIIDVMKNHQFALIKRRGKWELIESAEKKRLAGDLIKTEKKIAALYNFMTEGVALHEVVYDASGKAVDYVVADVNPAFEKITGLPKEQSVGKKASELYGTGDPPYLDIYAKVASTGKPASFETYFAPMQKHFKISVFSPSKGKFNTVFYDITEHKKAEEAIRLLKDRFEMAQRAARVGVWDWDIKTGLIDWTPEMFKLFGLDPDKETASFEIWESVLHPDDREKAAAKIDEALKTQSFLDNEYRVIRPDGRVIWINALGQGEFDDQNQPTRMSGICIDISEHKRAEEILREQNSAINSASDAIFSTDNAFTIKSWNKAAENIFGWTAEEVIGKASTSISDATYPCLNGASREQAVEQLKSKGFWRGEVIYHRKDGSPIPVSASASLVKDESGKVVGMVAVVHDITARKKREAVLREAQRDLNRAQAVAKTGSWRLDVQRNILLWSIENHRIFGVPEGTPMTYETFLEIVHPDDKKYVDRKWKAGLRGEPYDIEHRIVVDSKVKWVREKAELEVDTDGTLLGGFGTTQEITDLVEMREKLEDYSKHLEKLVEEQTKLLRDAERLAAIGETAGMIGHDIRNPLQAIIGELYLSKDSLRSIPEGEAKQELADSMRVIEEQVVYINKIVTDLQDYAKPLAPRLEENDVEQIVDSVLSTMDIPETIEVTYSIEKGFPKLIIDASYMKRILTNLIANARQAMPNGGKITINAYCLGDKAFVSVEDTGEGIPEGAKSRIFKPLFTTKAKGQGFGLPVVKRLTEALNGTVTLETEEGKGTKFIVELPKNSSCAE